MPWKAGEGAPDLLNNERIARHRLHSLGRSLDKDLNLKDNYTETLNQIEKDQVIVEIPCSEKNCQYPICDLTHHPMIKESNMTTKIRPVIDASAAGYYIILLNDCLEAGPALLPNLSDVVLRKFVQFGNATITHHHI